MRLPPLLLAAYLLIGIGGERSCAQPPRSLEQVELQDLSDANASTDPQPTDQQSTPSAQSDQYFLESPFGDSDDSQPIQPSDPMETEDAESKDVADADDSDEDNEQIARDKATLAHLQQLRKPVGEISLTAGLNRTDVPDDRTKALQTEATPEWVTSSGGSSLKPNRYTECITHQPLYYEHANLERCGIGHGCFQSTLSGVRFFRDTMFLPYKMGRQHPSVLVRSGGDCQSCQSFPSSLRTLRTNGCSTRGAMSEAAALAGFSLLLL